jgi:hypothetical protein
MSSAAEQVLAAYTTWLRHEQDVSPATLRNYVSDLRQFLAWCEATAGEQSGSPVGRPTLLAGRHYEGPCPYPVKNQAGQRRCCSQPDALHLWRLPGSPCSGTPN